MFSKLSREFDHMKRTSRQVTEGLYVGKQVRSLLGGFERNCARYLKFS
jgi:hypothetical protein